MVVPGAGCKREGGHNGAGRAQVLARSRRGSGSCGGRGRRVRSIPDSAGVIDACYQVDKQGQVTGDGKVRLIDPASPNTNAQACKSNELPLDWNQQGLQGDTGPQGPIGATGERGDTGPVGATRSGGNPRHRRSDRRHRTGGRRRCDGRDRHGGRGRRHGSNRPAWAARLVRGDEGLQRLGERQRHATGVRLHGHPYRGQRLIPRGLPGGNVQRAHGNFIIPAVMPINSASTWIVGASSIAPIAADGSAAFSVQFNSGETLFAFVVAVAIH